MSDKKLFVKCVLVLSCIALAAGLLLGLFSQVTEITEEERAARASKKIEEIRPGSYVAADLSGYRTNLERGSIGYLFVEEGETTWYAAVVTGHKGYGGDVEFYVLLEGDTLREIRVGTNKETPGISDSALKNESFFARFTGKTVEELNRALNLSDDIDGASGATYSSRGTKNAMAALAEFMCAYLGGEV